MPDETKMRSVSRLQLRFYNNAFRGIPHVGWLPIGRLLLFLLSLFHLSGLAIANSDLAFFETPSRNIYCVYSGPNSNYPHSNVECEIRQFTPSFDLSYTKERWSGCYPLNTPCTPDNFDRYFVGAKSSVGDNSCGCMDIANCIDVPAACQEVETLEYGKSFRRGGIECRSEKEGLTCKNSEGHGFFLSKAKQSVF